MESRWTELTDASSKLPFCRDIPSWLLPQVGGIDRQRGADLLPGGAKSGSALELRESPSWFRMDLIQTPP